MKYVQIIASLNYRSYGGYYIYENQKSEICNQRTNRGENKELTEAIHQYSYGNFKRF